MHTAIEAAIDVGYRLFDTAFLYETEAGVGNALYDCIQSGKVKREDLFITTKVSTFFEFALLLVFTTPLLILCASENVLNFLYDATLQCTKRNMRGRCKVFDVEEEQLAPSRGQVFE